MRRRSAAWWVLLLLPIPSPPAEEPAPAPLRLLGPRRGAAREQALARFGGTRASEAAVTAGLEWLARHRRENGGWDADGFADRCTGEPRCSGPGKGQHGEDVACPFDAPITALATLAFLGRGHLPHAEPDDAHRETVATALAALRDGSPGTWALPLTAQVFAEAAALGGDASDLEFARGLVQRLLANRQPDGGFGYAAPGRPGSDVPYTALCVQALVAAADAGVPVPEDVPAGIDAFLSSLELKDGRLAYLRDGRRYGYTPTATNGHLAAAVRELLQVGTNGTRHRAHLALLSRERPVWEIGFETVKVTGRGTMAVQVGNLSLYQWWYGTIAAFHHGGGSWSTWFRAAQKALVEHQRQDGCARGSWDPAGTYERQTGGRVFATALAVLILEQPYRHRRR